MHCTQCHAATASHGGLCSRCYLRRLEVAQQRIISEPPKRIKNKCAWCNEPIDDPYACYCPDCRDYLKRRKKKTSPINKFVNGTIIV